MTDWLTNLIVNITKTNFKNLDDKYINWENIKYLIKIQNSVAERV